MIGQITLRLYAASGAYPLIGVDFVDFRRELARHTPGVATADPRVDDLRDVLRELNFGALPDIVVDATGAPNAVRSAMSSVADGGQVIMVGSPRGFAGDVDFYWNLHGRSIALIGAHGSALGVDAREKFPFRLERGLRLLVHLLETGRLRLDDLITHEAPATEAQAMYEGLLHRGEEYVGVTLHW
jgi:threonine dehydrogenase-like Zn-dependent dehydrogenase